MRFRVAVFWACLLFFIPAVSAFAVESFPPIVPEGEKIPNIEELIQNINRRAAVFSVAFSPDGRYLASGSNDGTVSLWDVESGQEVRRLEGHTDDVKSVSFSPDGRYLASGSKDQTIRLWDVESGQEVRRLEGHTDTINSVSFNPEGWSLASGANDRTVRLWDVASGREVRRLEMNAFLVFSVAFSPDGRYLATALGGTVAHNTVSLWNVESGREVRRFEGHTAWVLSVSFSPDGRYLASGSGGMSGSGGNADDDTIRLWDVESGREVRRLEKHALGVPIQSVSFSPDGRYLASGSGGPGGDNAVRVWDVESGREVRQLEGHATDVNSVSFSPDGRYLASGSGNFFGKSDTSVRLWGVESGLEVRRLEGHATDVTSVSFSPDGRYLASASNGTTVRLWGVESGQEVRRFEGHATDVTSVTFSPDGRYLASGSKDKTVRLWDVESGREVRRLVGHKDIVNSVSFSPDGRYLASGSGGHTVDLTVRLWDVESGREVRRLGHNPSGVPVRSVSFSPNGRYLASGASGSMHDTAVRLWDVESGREVWRVEGNVSMVLSVNFSPDGRYLASAANGSGNYHILLLDVGTGREVRRLKGHASYVNSVCFSPDGRYLASGSDDQTVRLWDLENGREVRRLEEHKDDVNSVSFSPGGRYLASGSKDKTLKLWEVESGKKVKMMVPGVRGSWLTYDVKNGITLRQDDGHFLVSKKDGKIDPVPPPETGDSKKPDIDNPIAKLKISGGNSANFIIKVTNPNKNKLFWAHIVALPSKDAPIIFHPPPKQVVLEPNQTVDMACMISMYSQWKNPKSNQVTLLNLQIRTAHTKPVPLSIPVEISLPDLKIIEYKILETNTPSIQLAVQNIGEQSINPVPGSTKQPLEFSITVDGIPVAEKKTYPGIDFLETIEMSLNIPKNIDIGVDSIVILTAKKNAFPAHEWQMILQQYKPPWQLYALLATLLAATGLGVYFLYLFRHPLTLRLSRSPEDLRHLDLSQLPQAKTLLTRTRRMASTLTDAAVQRTWIEKSIQFLNQPAPQPRCDLLAERLSTTCHPRPDAPLPLFSFQMGDDFMLNMDRCLLAFPPETMEAQAVLGHLKQDQNTNFHPCLVVTTHEAQQTELRKASHSPENWLVTPDNRELTELLLSPNPHEALARLIASQVKITRISPYQTRGGVAKESIFFGRNQLLADILQREPANYLLVGGRQLGKTSLLKAIQRRHQNRPDAHCHLLVLHNQDIAPHLARALELPSHTPLPGILDHIAAKQANGRLLFLVDEADKFVAADAQNGYETLHLLRSLGGEGRCQFILAGFWGLFQAAEFDYQSPIKNFAETKFVGALEPDACRQMATEPMHMLNLRYDSGDLVETLVHRTGGRANLIAILCNEILGYLGPADRVITADHVDRALDAAAVRAALGGWERITGDARADRLDRMVIYATVDRQPFTTEDLVNLLETAGANFTPEEIRQSLARLELAFVLKREKGNYSFCVPLFVDIIREQGPETLFRLELEEGRAGGMRSI